VPTQGRPKFTIRKDELVEEFIAACPVPKEDGGAAHVVREFMAWYLRHRGAKLPDRPAKLPKRESESG
jgi:hypothetical protein